MKEARVYVGEYERSSEPKSDYSIEMPMRMQLLCVARVLERDVVVAAQMYVKPRHEVQ